MRSIIHALLGMVLLACHAAAGAQAPAPALKPAFIGFHQPVTPALLEELEADGAVDGLEIPTINAVAVTAPLAMLQRYAQDPRVRGVRLQRRIELHLYSSLGQIQADAVSAPFTHEGIEVPGATGAGVTVAVIDTGVFAPHPDLLPRAMVGRNFEFTLAQRETGILGAAEWDLYAEASGAVALQDEVGHGTHVAGIIGGSGFSAQGLDIRGVAPGASFVAMKIASPFNGLVEDIGFEANAVAAIDHMIRHREALGNVRVANNSWGLLAEEAQGLLGPTDFDPAAEVTKAAVEAGIVMVFSAGNDGPEPETVRPVPNGLDEVITVAAACKADRGGCPDGSIAGFSSRGPAVDVTAPGDQIISTQSPSVLLPIGQALEGSYFGDSPQDEAINRLAYYRLSGTSMSSPHVAGVVALLLEANPALSPAEVEQILIETADDMVAEGDLELIPGYDTASGHGMVNVRAALARAVAGETTVARAASTSGRSGGGVVGLLAVMLLLAHGARRRRTRA